MNGLPKHGFRLPKASDPKLIDPVRDAFAKCDKCELKYQHNLKQSCFAYQPLPASWNGIMIVGEGPGRTEVVEGRPFIGPSGKLLDALLKAEGAKLDDCYITNATLCRPPEKKDKAEKNAFMDRFPHAVHSCLSRLEEEIARVRPRVIVTLGAAALVALTGYEEKVTKRVSFTCDYCGPDRKIKGVQCAKGDCKYVWEAPKMAGVINAEPVKPDVCPQCSASWKKLKIKGCPCPKCGSRKMREEEQTHWDWDYSLSEVAGGVIPAAKHGWDDYGVKYIVPTFHPSFLLHEAESTGSGEKKVMKGQFAAKSVQRNLRKALYLAKHDAQWEFEFEVTSNDDADAAAHLDEYIYSQDPTPFNFAVDIETKAYGIKWHCKKCDKLSELEEPLPKHLWNADVGTCRTYVDTHEHLTEGWCKKCAAYTAQEPKWGELDARVIENVTHAEVCGFYDRKRGYGLVVDTRRLGPKLRAKLKEVLEDPRVRKTYQNGGYDVICKYRLWDVWVAGYVDDTLSQHHVLCPDETHTLAHIGFRYTMVNVWKPPKQLKGRNAHENFADLCQYNGRDCAVAYDAREVMAAEIYRKGNFRNVYELDMKLQQQALAMQRNGMPVDMDAAMEAGATALKLRNEALEGMREIVRNGDFNPANPTQLRTALYSTLGYEVSKMTASGRDPSTDAQALMALPDTPFKRHLLLFREHGDTLKSYFDVSRGVAVPGRGIRLWWDGRMHASWKPFGSRSGRFTSSPNFQNWPKWMRAMVRARKGRRIVGADFDQLELRIVAALSDDALLIDKCLNADDSRKLEPEHDPHSYVAQIAFGAMYTNLLLKDPAHDKANPKCKCQTCQRKALRDLCKRVIYGLNYGAGESTILEAVYKGGYNGPPLSIEMLTRIKNAIFRAFSGIPRWRDGTLSDARRNQAVFSPILGRWRTFPLGVIPPTEVYNYPIQSAGADIINIQNTIFYLEYMHQIDPTALYMAQVHDAVYYEVDEDRADVFAEQLTKTLSSVRALKKGGTEMPFTAAASHSDNWKEAA